MKRREDLYNLGNDYAQVTSAYFETEVEGAYSDGLFHYTKKKVYELSGGADALNKRILNVLPQSAWAPADFKGAETFSAVTDASAVFSPDYATGIADGTVAGPFKQED